MGIEQIPLSQAKLPEKDFRFEEKFKEREVIKLPGGDIKVLDVSPEHLLHENPTLLIPGYSDNAPESRKANISTLYEEGRRALMVESASGADVEISDPKVNEFSDSLLRQVAAIEPVLEQKNIKVDAIGESRGGVVVLLAAYLYPEKFNNIVLIDPAGMVESMNAAKLTMRFIMTGIAEGRIFAKREKMGDVSAMAKEQVVWGTANFVKWVASNPMKRVEEIKDLSHVEVAHLLSEIKALGIGISIIHGVNDKVFPMEDMQASITNEINKVREKMKNEGAHEDEIANAYKKVVDGFYSVRGGHGDFNTNPEKYTWLASNALTALEEKKKNKKADKPQ